MFIHKNKKQPLGCSICISTILLSFHSLISLNAICLYTFLIGCLITVFHSAAHWNIPVQIPQPISICSLSQIMLWPLSLREISFHRLNPALAPAFGKTPAPILLPHPFGSIWTIENYHVLYTMPIHTSLTTEKSDNTAQCNVQTLLLENNRRIPVFCIYQLMCVSIWF